MSYRKADKLETLYLDTERRKDDHLEAVKAAVFAALRVRDKLQVIKECSTLCKAQQYELDMAIETIARGERILGDKINEYSK